MIYAERGRSPGFIPGTAFFIIWSERSLSEVVLSICLLVSHTENSGLAFFYELDLAPIQPGRA